MLEQLFDIVKKFGKDSVVENPDVPNEYNNDVMADATKTITSGFQNVVAGGGFQNILDLFRGGGNTGGGGIGGLVKNPMVSMMIGYFISKLVSKYRMSPAAASNVANNLIPNSLQGIIAETNNPDNPGFTLDGLIGSVTGGQAGGGSSLQNLLDQFSGGTDTGAGGGFNIQELVGGLTRKAQDNFNNQQESGSGGLVDLIRGFFK